MTDSLIVADCLAALTHLPDGCCRLIYLDPPFNTNTRRSAPLSPKGRRVGGERRMTYNDAFGSPTAYIAYMRPRVEAMRRVLVPGGSLFFHCDWRMGHHVRVMLDEVFLRPSPQLPLRREEGAGNGEEREGGVFVNEIVWHYGLGASRASRRLLTKHDVIFWYASSPGYIFNLLRDEPTPAMLGKYRHFDEAGNRYMNSYGRRYPFKGGKPLDDVWDIPAIAPTSEERVGYPTQKPLALLRRIILLASHPGDLVLDPFCGSGTTLVAAQQLGRRWIGIDSNPQAIAVARRRLGIAL